MGTILIEELRRMAGELQEDASCFLMDMIRTQSTVMNEMGAQALAIEKLQSMGLVPRLCPIHEDLKKDPEYSFADRELLYDGTRGNVLCDVQGTGGGRSLILQSHLDVVPAEEDWIEAFAPAIDKGVVRGRGSCDALGQIVTMIVAIQILQRRNIQLKGNVLLQMVIEEEVGGNGALAAIREGHKADGVVVLEPTELQIHPANRGAIWFRVTTTGKSVHMGRILEGVSAIDKCTEVIRLFKEYEKVLVEESKGFPLFERYDQPVQLNVGMIQGGLIPSMVPSACTIEGGVGFLPNKSMSEVKEELTRAILATKDEWLKSNFKLEFPKLHNDSYETDPRHPLVTTFEEAATSFGLPSEVFGWNVSCDARLYARLADMPTLVFGPGAISDAHSSEEKIVMEDISKAASALAIFIVNWCGS